MFILFVWIPVAFFLGAWLFMTGTDWLSANELGQNAWLIVSLFVGSFLMPSAIVYGIVRWVVEATTPVEERGPSDHWSDEEKHYLMAYSNSLPDEELNPFWERMTNEHAEIRRIVNEYAASKQDGNS